MMLEHVLVLSAYLFSIGIYGLITSRNMVRPPSVPTTSSNSSKTLKGKGV